MGQHRKNFWTVLETKSATSGEAMQHAARQGFECYHPKYREAPVRGVRKIVPLFPRYLFVLVRRSQNWRPLAYTRDIKRVILGAGTDTPAIVPHSEIERLRSLENEIGYVEPDFTQPPSFVAEQAVVGERGLFRDKHGIYKGLVGNRADRVRVLFEIIGRPVVHEMSAYDLAPVLSAA